MRSLFIGVVCSIFLLGGIDTADAVTGKKTANREDVGRYQLFQGEYTSYDLKRQQMATVSAVFVIDTVTGVVKRYVNKIDQEGRFIETWVTTNHPVPDTKKTK